MEPTLTFIEQLQVSFDNGTETCHGGCKDKAQKLVLHGKHVGAFCYECYREIVHGKIQGP